MKNDKTHTSNMYIPETARTAPTSALEKLNPPFFLGLTAHNEKIWKKRKN